MNEYVQGSNPLNYQVAWVVAHEFLHQLCIKAYYHISICSGSNIVIMNPFKEMEKFIHYNDKRAHLNTAADNEKVRVLNLLPSTEPTTLKNYEEILEEHLLLINYYRILLLVPYSNFVKKLYAQKFLDEINTVFKIK